MYDLVTAGEVLLRLSVPRPGRFETAHELDVQIGGAEANVAAACARLGLRTAWISALPDNAWGQRVRRELSGHGIDCEQVVMLPGTRLGLYFLEYGVSPRPTRVLYDRQASAFTRLTVDAVDWQVVRQSRLVHVSGITPALGDNGRALIRRIIEEAPVLSFDVNYRAALWAPHEARAFAESVLPAARYVFLGQSEAETVFQLTGSPENILTMLQEMAPDATITLLQGREGSTTLAGPRCWRPTVRHSVEVTDSIGAGDAYVAGFLWATLRGGDLQQAVNAAATVAALKCSTWGDIALISERDVADVLAGGPDVRR